MRLIFIYYNFDIIIHIMFSLCIPTMDRYDDFLSKYLPKYLEIDLIDEIIITDENGNDVAKIREAFSNHPKLRLFVNETRLGTLINKLRACSYAKNEWIALIDSDNFAGEDYFTTAKNYIDNNIPENKKNIILSPCNARPDFNFYNLAGYVYKIGDFEKNKMIEEQSRHLYNNPGHHSTLMNLGNYVINKYLTNNINLYNENNRNFPSPYDVIYMNTLLFEQLDLNLHVVPNMEYNHVVHNGSAYIQTCEQFVDFSNDVHARFNNLR